MEESVRSVAAMIPVNRRKFHLLRLDDFSIRPVQMSEFRIDTLRVERQLIMPQLIYGEIRFGQMRNEARLRPIPIGTTETVILILLPQQLRNRSKICSALCYAVSFWAKTRILCRREFRRYMQRSSVKTQQINCVFAVRAKFNPISSLRI